MKQLAVIKDYIGLLCAYKDRNAVIILKYQDCKIIFHVDSTNGFQIFFSEESIISIKSENNSFLYNDWDGNYFTFDCDTANINNSSSLKVRSKHPYIEYSIINNEYIVGVTKDHILFINGILLIKSIDVQISQNSYGLFFIKEFNLISIVIYRLHTELYFIKVDDV